MTILHAIAQGHFLFVDIRDPEITLGIVCLRGNLRSPVSSCGQSRMGLTDRGAPIHTSPGVRTPHSPRVIQVRDLGLGFFFFFNAFLELLRN